MRKISNDAHCDATVNIALYPSYCLFLLLNGVARQLGTSLIIIIPFAVGVRFMKREI